MADNSVVLEENILDIPAETHYWFVRANSRAEYYEDFKTNNYISSDANGVPFLDLMKISTAIRASDDALKDAYKTVFNNHDIKKYNDNPRNQQKTKEKQKEERTTELTKSSRRASKIRHFVEDMAIGDIVIVPSLRANFFLLGIIISDVFDTDINHIGCIDDEGRQKYPTSDFDFKRRVFWIKEVGKSSFPDKLSWIKTAHQSLFDVTAEGADVINPLLAPVYRYKGKVYTRIGVNTNEKVKAADWLKYQTVVIQLAEKDPDAIYQKTKVQSMGDVLLFVEQHKIEIGLLVYAALFGEISFERFGFKIHQKGLLRYFLPENKKQTKLDNNKQQAEINLTNAQAAKTLAETEKINAETEALRQGISDNRDNATQDEVQKERDLKNAATYVSSRDEENKNKIVNLFSVDDSSIDKVNLPKYNDSYLSDVQRSMQLSNAPVGHAVEPKTQIDNLNLEEDESQTKK